MLDAALDFIRERLMQNVSAVCEETKDPLERLKRLSMRHARLIRESQALPRIVFSEEIYSGFPQRKARVRRVIEEYLAKVGSILQQGQKQGAISNRYDAGTMSVIFLGLIQPAAVLWYLKDGDFDVTRQVERAWNLFEAAIEDDSKKGTTTRRRRGK